MLLNEPPEVHVIDDDIEGGSGGTGGSALEKTAWDLVGKLFGPAVEQAGMIAGDWVSYWRLKNLRKIERKVSELRDQHQKTVPKRIEPRIGITLIEGAANEDDDSLQELWANLIFRAGDQNTSEKSARWVAKVLAELDPNDALILESLQGGRRRELGLISDEIANVQRLGLISIETVETPGEVNVPEQTYVTEQYYHLSDAGRAFVRAITVS